jgi:Ca2+-binding EF-hand superfamily protein
MTRKSVASVRLVPSIVDDPKAWFAVCDVDGDERLSRREVVEALKAQLPLDNAALEQYLTDDAKWRTWDADGSGSIEFVEIMDKERGLLAFVLSTFQRQRQNAAVPDIRRDRDGWFRHWDEDGSGELDVDEVVRAFTKTFRIDVATIAQLRECLQAVWIVFDTDGDGTVSREEFLRPSDGLADTVIATLGIETSLAHSSL